MTSIGTSARRAGSALVAPFLAWLLASACATGAAAPPGPGPASGTPVGACSPDEARRLQVPPPPDEDSVYGIGIGRSDAEAVERARVEAAASLEVQVRAETTDHQVAWVPTGRTDAAPVSAQKVEAISHSLVERRLQECRRLVGCGQGGEVRALVACSRRSPLEIEIARRAAHLAGALPPASSVLVLPATDESGWITGFGEYASGILRDALERRLAGGARLKRIGPWAPVALHEVARAQGVTHVVRAELTRAGALRLRLRTWLVGLATEEPIAGTSDAFEVDVEPAHVELMEIRGPLFPLKDALDLAGVAGSRNAAELKLPSATFREGQQIEIDVKVAEDSYVYLFSISENGQAGLILPNAAIRENRMTGGWHHLPDEAWKKSGMAIRACPLPGQRQSRESVKLVASPTPLDLPLDRFFGPDPVTMTGGPQGTISDVVGKLNALRERGVPFTTATAVYMIQADSAAGNLCPH